MKIALSTFILLLLAAAAGASEPRYHLTDLGDVSGYGNRGQSLSSNGLAAGLVYHGGFPDVYSPFVWTSSSGMQSIGHLPANAPTDPNDAQYGAALGVNAAGVVVGEDDVVPLAGGGHRYAFIWSQADGLQQIPVAPIGEYSDAFGINDHGEVVGNISAGGYVWSKSGGLLRQLDGTAYDINNAGQVVGVFGSVPALWSPTGVRQNLGQLPGYTDFGSATAISSDGQVVGGSEKHLFTAPYTLVRAFRWTQSGGMENLGILKADDTASQAFGVNAAGQVIGLSYGPSGVSTFLWTASEGMRDLNDLTDAPDWSLFYAFDINDAGQILGTASGPNGNHTVILTPIPEPSTATLAAAALACTFAWSVRRRLLARAV